MMQAAVQLEENVAARRRSARPLLIIGALIVLWGALTFHGTLDALHGYLHPQALAPGAGTDAVAPLAAIKREQVALSLLLGGLFAAFGLLMLTRHVAPGDRRHYLATLPGVALIVGIAFVVRWVLDPLLSSIGKRAQDAGFIDWNFAAFLNLNYIVLGLAAGILVANTRGLPVWARAGVHEPSRLCLKAGVILLGALYTGAELAQLSAASLAMIGAFIVASLALVLRLARRLRTSDSMTGLLAAGLSVCGVSAVVATASVVNARASETAYTIATILLWGIIGLFLFPMVGRALGLDSEQLGAWVGTAILDSSQVLGAALAYDPNDVHSLKVAGVFNIMRVMFLPVVLLWLAVWYTRRQADRANVQTKSILLGKFPWFVLGFLAMFALGSFGVFGAAVDTTQSFRNGVAWLFTFGLVGLGMQISFGSIKEAGRRPLLIGTAIALFKAVGALLVVVYFI